MEYKYAQALSSIRYTLQRGEYYKTQSPRKLYSQEKLDKFAKNYK